MKYSDIEKKVLKTALGQNTFKRWSTLCSLMSEGICLAAEDYDRDLPKRGWFHVCAWYLSIIPDRPKRDRLLAPHEFWAREIDDYCNVFRPIVRSFRRYMENLYPGFDYKSGKWSLAGVEDRSENPFPFFICENLQDDEDDAVVTLDMLFEIVPEDCGEIFHWSGMFCGQLARVTDDYDAELECGEFAGNVDEDALREIVASYGGHKVREQSRGKAKIRVPLRINNGVWLCVVKWIMSVVGGVMATLIATLVIRAL